MAKFVNLQETLANDPHTKAFEKMYNFKKVENPIVKVAVKFRKDQSIAAIKVTYADGTQEYTDRQEVQKFIDNSADMRIFRYPNGEAITCYYAEQQK